MFWGEKLNELYKDIQICHICPQMDGEKSLRLVDAVNPKSDVFIISQTLAENQLRKSGVNFFQDDGSLGNTGANLERFLNKFCRTVYPNQEVMISGNVTVPSCNPKYKSVYNTEIAQCYPGKNKVKKGDRKPRSDEILNCHRKGFLIKEIIMIQPRLLLLMGKESRDSFFDYFLTGSYPSSLSDHISAIIDNGKIPVFTIGNLTLHVLPIQHASGANPRFSNMINNNRLVELIIEVLE
jgi:uracil-DNA glycosylase